MHVESLIIGRTARRVTSVTAVLRMLIARPKEIAIDTEQAGTVKRKAGPPINKEK
jgi:hypothetical protein